MSFFETFLKPVLVLILGALLAALGGCAAQDAQLSMVQEVTALTKAWGDKAINETSMRAVNVSGGAQGLNPKLVVETEVYAGPCVKVRASVGAEGISGQVLGNAQADGGQAADVKPPAIRKEPDAAPPLDDAGGSAAPVE